MKKTILTAVILFGLISTGFSNSIGYEVSSASFPPPVLELA
ncbi:MULTISPECIES: hypothetical protein [unclassified Francisella]|nr:MULTISPECIES: hypothetical protein [unclassified Francisella]MED7818327.1 hypothetical protein [Francisella sp. 19S2-4]MED7829163.1 hypothetical protein [Francisella sp. 19S2-10]